MRETKNQKSAIKILPGHVARVRVRCGKSNCRCAHGQRHTVFYHVTYDNGVRSRRYIRRAEVENVRAACEAHRGLQTRLRQGRALYRQLIAEARSLFREI